jgi:flagellar assembly factor FliW
VAYLEQLNTKYFGEISYGTEDCISFPDGLFGFEQEKKFLLLPFTEGEDSLFCLQSISTEDLAFVVINPFAFVSDYNPMPSSEDIKELQANNDGELEFFVICVMRDTIETSSANLKCPILINPQKKLAKQVILDDPQYTFRHFFQSFSINNKEG